MYGSSGRTLEEHDARFLKLGSPFYVERPGEIYARDGERLGVMDTIGWQDRLNFVPSLVIGNLTRQASIDNLLD